MESIILITGNVRYTITLDPGVWIFDDRRIDLTTYFDSAKKPDDSLEEYTKSISKHWDREITEGAIYPPTIQSEKKFKKEQILNGTFGIPFHDFLKNASPNESSGSVKVITDKDTVVIPIDDAYNGILGFSLKGKPLKEDGPVHLYYGDGSNRDNPIKNIREFIVE
ncbi:hypothetical protein [Litchfieldia alkalitelluris]|uniref:hypothetical protein n=1 Tax=Litchfieldia alkalitelluris TaxID=304268 RepID=UPI000996E5CA|nr:hypothetical protein [Litchfieldia alkalitelluris]